MEYINVYVDTLIATQREFLSTIMTLKTQTVMLEAKVNELNDQINSLNETVLDREDQIIGLRNELDDSNGRYINDQTEIEDLHKKASNWEVAKNQLLEQKTEIIRLNKIIIEKDKLIASSSKKIPRKKEQSKDDF